MELCEHGASYTMVYLKRQRYSKYHFIWWVHPLFRPKMKIIFGWFANVVRVNTVSFPDSCHVTDTVCVLVLIVYHAIGVQVVLFSRCTSCLFSPAWHKWHVSWWGSCPTWKCWNCSVSGFVVHLFVCEVWQVEMQGPALPCRCCQSLWLMSPLLRLMLGGAIPGIRWSHNLHVLIRLKNVEVVPS